jgi:hypothetical protein
MNRTVVLRIAVVTGALILVGCALSDDPSGGVGRPAASKLQEGLSVLDAADAEWGFDAAYVANGHAVYFSSRVGVEKAEIYRLIWPEDPTQEMDARFVDERGETFMLRVGGDSFIDPTWSKDIQDGHTANPKGDPAHRAISFRLAGEMATALRAELGKRIPRAFAHHVFHATSMGKAGLPQVAQGELDALGKAPLVNQGDVAYSTNGDSNQYYVQLYAGTVVYIPGYPSGCSALPSPMGGCGSQSQSWHTALRFWNYRYNNGSSYWDLYVDACNHGRCAYDGLTYANGRWGTAGWIWNNRVDSLWLQSPDQNNSGTGVNGACQTSYNWYSGSGSHLCNDDAAYESWQMDRGFADTSRAWSTTTWNYKYTSYYVFSCTKNDSTARYACDCSNCYRDWLPPCIF